METSRLTRDGTAEIFSRDQVLRRERGQGNINIPCSADHEQDGQSYPVDTYSCYMFDHTCMVITYNRVVVVVVVSHIQRIGCQPEKTIQHGGQSRSWSVEQGTTG